MIAPRFPEKRLVRNCRIVNFPPSAGLKPPRFRASVWIRYRMEEHIEVEGKVIAVLAGTMFRVELDNKHIVLATISGKMRKRFVRLTPGDRVKMEMSPYDLNKARVIWRIG